MKKLILIFAALVVSAGTALAQNYMVVDSEKVFTSIEAYTKAQADVEAEVAKRRKEIDDTYDQIEKLFNTYQGTKASLSAAIRAETEQKIVNFEREAKKLEEKAFGQDGDIMKMREERLKPIRDKVSEAIKKYAEEQGFDIVLDVASNPSVLYYKPTVDRTEAIIAIVK